MFRLGMILLGAALVLHGRSKAEADDSQPDAPGDDTPPPPGSKMPEPTLDPALSPPGVTNPFLIGPETGGTGNPNTAFQFPNTASNPNTWFGQNPELGFLARPGATDIVGGTITGNQLSAANNVYKKISDPNLFKRAFNFQKRVIKKIFG